MNTAQWPQDIVMRASMEEIIASPNPKASNSVLERKVKKPQKLEQILNCPRCNSTNTKFCYYNNYSLSQPRYFCKTCRRYWTEGGSLRNIPVGGGSRKNKIRGSSSSSSSSSKIPADSSISPTILIPINQNPKINIHESQDLNLGFSNSKYLFKNINDLISVPNFDQSGKEIITKYPSCSSSSALELLTNSSTSSSGGLIMTTSFMPMQITTTTTTTNLSEPSLNFSLDHGLGSNYGSFQGVQETNGKLLFPFQDLKHNTTEAEHNSENQHGQHTTGSYWNGVNIGTGGESW